MMGILGALVAILGARQAFARVTLTVGGVPAPSPYSWHFSIEGPVFQIVGIGAQIRRSAGPARRARKVAARASRRQKTRAARCAWAASRAKWCTRSKYDLLCEEGKTILHDVLALVGMAFHCNRQ